MTIQYTNTNIEQLLFFLVIYHILLPLSVWVCDLSYTTSFICLGLYQNTLGASQVALVVKNPLINAGDIRDVDLILGLERSTGGGHGNPLQYTCLEHPHGQRSLVGYSPESHRVRHY